MKIYTKTGDEGETGLYGGQRVRKDSPRVEACGTVDELNASLGSAVALLTEEDLAGVLTDLQKDLFVLGADVATPPDSKTARRTPRIGPAHIRRIEKGIDEAQSRLPPQTRFFLPGGCPASGALDLARSVCRRAERRLWTVQKNEAVNPDGLVYLNRLSDFLYVLARVVNQRHGVKEIPWEPDGKEEGEGFS